MRRTIRRAIRRDLTLGMPIDRDKAERIRDLAWNQQRTVADLLRELVTEALKARGIDLSAPAEAMSEAAETTHATA